MGGGSGGRRHHHGCQKVSPRYLRAIAEHSGANPVDPARRASAGRRKPGSSTLCPFHCRSRGSRLPSRSASLGRGRVNRSSAGQGAAGRPRSARRVDVTRCRRPPDRMSFDDRPIKRIIRTWSVARGSVGRRRLRGPPTPWRFATSLRWLTAYQGSPPRRTWRGSCRRCR